VTTTLGPPLHERAPTPPTAPRLVRRSIQLALVRAVAGGDPARFDQAEIPRQLDELLASRDGLAATGLFDLHGVLLSSPVAPELVGRSASTLLP